MSDTVYRTRQATNGRWYRHWTEGVKFDTNAQLQVNNLLNFDFVKNVAVMADTHWGMGGPVGVAVQFQGAIIPAVIGVDIGCGMYAMQLADITGDDLTPEVCQELLKTIDRVVPNGITPGADRGSWGEAPSDVKQAWENDHNGEELSLNDQYSELVDRFHRYTSPELYLRPLMNGVTAQHRDPLSQLGTLGSGNHFFEVSVDELNRAWLVVHSGSRGAGARIGDYFFKRAQDLMQQWFIKLPSTLNEKKNEIQEDHNLAYLPVDTVEYDAYIDFMQWAQKYAKANRSLMMHRVLNIALPPVLKRYVMPGEISFDIHHNYLDTETLIARKGAVHLVPGELAIIPGAMGARTYIVRGREGLSQSMETCSHGAGRAMSRNEATKNISPEQHKDGLAGVACDDSADTVDEDKKSYKDIDAVINAQRDLVEPLHILTAKVCLKGKSMKRR